MSTAVKDIRKLFVGKPVDATNVVDNQQIKNENASLYVKEGQIVVTDPNGKILDTGNTIDKTIPYVIVSMVKNGVVRSARIEGEAITHYQATSYTAASEKIVKVGYDGSAGNLTDNLSANTTYSLKFVNKSINPYAYYDLFHRSGDVAPKENEIADGLALNGVMSFQQDPANKENLKLPVEIHRVTDSTNTALTVATGNLTVTKGSKFVQAATDVDAESIAEGKYLDLNGSVYKIVSMDTSAESVELDAPYQGESGTITASNASTITVSDAEAGNWGLRFVGTPLKYEPGKYPYEKLFFEVSKSSTITGDIKTTQEVSEGVGEYPEVADMEWNSEEYFGGHYVVDMIENSKKLLADKDLTYDRITVVQEPTVKLGLEGNYSFPSSVVMYVPSATNDQADKATQGFLRVLDAYVTAWGNGTAQVGNLTA